MADSRRKDARHDFIGALKNADSVNESTRIYLEFIRDAIRELSERRAPVTKLLIFVTLTIFAVQLGLFLRVNENMVVAILTFVTERGSLEGLNAWLFINYPFIAWPLSEFIHRGLGHFVVNIGLLSIFGGYVEPRFRRRYFLLWFLLVSMTATPIHAVSKLLITTKPHVAVYGISDFVAALGLFSFLWAYGKMARTKLEYVLLILGGAIVFQTLIEIFTAVWMWSVAPVNVGHFVGGLLGIGMFSIYRRWEPELSP